MLSEIKEGTYVQNKCMVKEVNMRNIRISMNCFCQQQQKTITSLVIALVINGLYTFELWPREKWTMMQTMILIQITFSLFKVHH